MIKPLVSVVTVVYNAFDSIEGTIKSVLEQDAGAGGIEYWVVDGGSTDGTLDIIGSYSGRLRFVSASDQGIYDAMNKGVELCSGHWIVFMNAGDMFYSDNSIRDVFACESYSGVDVVYGDCVVDYGIVKKYRKGGSIDQLWKGSCFSHQSAFIDLNYHKRNFYNIKNRISADFEFFYELSVVGGVFFKVDRAIAVVTSGGLSDVKRVDAMVAWWNCVKKSNDVNFYYIKIILLEMLKGFVKNVIRRMRRKI